MHFPSSSQNDVPTPEHRLALKIDVDSLPGALQGVPALIDLLRQRSATATFLFTLGPDRSGRSLPTFIRSGVDRKCSGPGAIERYGWKGLLRGTLLPAPIIGEYAESSVRAAADAGFEVGLRPWDCHAWQQMAAHADAAWTQTQMQRACDRFVTIFGTSPRVFGASAWQMNRHAFRATQRLGFDYCSDTRGFRPYVPVYDAEIIACPQIPTTLPTFDELLADPRIDRESVVDRMADAFATPTPDGHVLTLSAGHCAASRAGAFPRSAAEPRRNIHVARDLLGRRRYRRFGTPSPPSRRPAWHFVAVVDAVYGISCMIESLRRRAWRESRVQGVSSLFLRLVKGKRP